MQIPHNKISLFHFQAVIALSPMISSHLVTSLWTGVAKLLPDCHTSTYGGEYCPLEGRRVPHLHYTFSPTKLPSD